MAVKSGAYPQTLAFDKVAARLYAQNYDTPLMVFTPAGIKEMEYKIPSVKGGEVRQILPHPAGHRALVIAGDRVMWVEMPAAG
jgi:hypothetical protein